VIPIGRILRSLVIAGRVRHHGPDMQRFFGFWFFYGGHDPA